MFIITTIVVGLMEVGPGVCQIDLMHPDRSIDQFYTKCELVAENYNQLK